MNNAVALLVRYRLAVAGVLAAAALAVAVTAPESRGPLAAIALLGGFGWFTRPHRDGARRTGPAATTARATAGVATALLVVALAFLATIVGVWVYIAVLTAG